jgi:hypothetical protein
MRIILNSDVLYSTRLFTTGLPKHIEDFCRKAAEFGAILALPRTVILESQRQQQKLCDEAMTKLEDAASLLREWGVGVPTFSASVLVQRIDVLSALRTTMIKVEVHDPTLEDYRDAELRASLHLSPQAPDTKTDEMRDLIIWTIALRLARHDGGAILVSRDEIHLHERGSGEANTAKLHRAKTFDEALDLLGAINPAVALARSVLAGIWNELKLAGMPLPEEVPSGRFSRLLFATDEEGHANTNLSFELSTDDGPLTGNARIFQASRETIKVDLTGLQMRGQQWKAGELSVTVLGELPKITQPLGERLTKLRGLIGESQ